MELKCKQPNCPSISLEKQDVVKAGLTYIKSEKKYYQRYLCNHCLKKFSTYQSTNRAFRERRSDIKKKIMDFYCEGMGLRPLSRALGVSRDTLKAKIKILADESYEEFYLSDDFKYQEQFHPLTKEQKKLGYKPNAKTPLIVFDEMETHEHTYLKPISIGIAYDFHNKKIMTVRCAEMRSRGIFADVGHQKYPDRKEKRAEMIEECFNDILKYLDLDKENMDRIPDIITDGKKQYATLLKKVFPEKSFNHVVIKNKDTVELDTTESPLITSEFTGLLKDPEHLRPQNLLKILVKLKLIKYKHAKAMGGFNKLCAVIRAGISTMKRTTFTHVKSMDSLQESLLVFMKHHNEKKVHITKKRKEKAIKIPTHPI
jgi:transposase-like protein